MVKTLSILLGLLIVAVMAGCAKDADEAKAPAPAATKVLDVQLVISPDPPVALKDTSLTATVKDASGNPVTGASVVFCLSMPGMYHGENRPQATESGPGVYTGTGVLTMGGNWLVGVEVTAPGAQMERHEFDAVAQGG